MKKFAAIVLFVIAGTFLCGNVFAYETYLPHLTSGSGLWDDYLQANNNTSTEASFTVTLYSNGAEVYSGVHAVAGLSVSLIELKQLAPAAETGKITYDEPGLNFRLSYENTGGGVAEFKTIDTLNSAVGLYFSDFTPSVTAKGMAIANFGPETAKVGLHAVGKDAVRQVVTVQIEPNEKIVGLHTGWFPAVDFSDIESIVAVADSPYLCGIAICSDADGSHLLFTPAARVFNLNGGQPSIVTGPEANILNTTVSSQGASMAIAGTGTVLDGSELTVAAGAFPDGATVSLQYAEITSHKLGNKVDPVMGLIRVKVGGGYAAELTSLKIPVTVTQDRYVMGFYVDEATGELSAVPSVYENGYVHLLARRFGTAGTVSAETVSARREGQGPWESASIIIGAFSVNAMLAMDAVSDFRPAADDWEFPNKGAYNSPNGICTGMTMTAMYYYYTQKPTQGPLYRKYDSLETLWQDNPQGYRWAAQTHEDYKRFNSLELFYNHYDLFAQSDLAQYLVLANAIYVTGQPQSLGIYADFGGHALIAYRTHNRKIHVADPNWPADESRTITLKADNTFEPYDGQFQQGGSNFKFPYIYFCAKDADIDWQLLEMGWREFTAGTAGTAVMPEYQLHLDGAKIENTRISRTNPVRLGIESNQAAGEDLGFQVYDSKGTFLATGYEAELNLDEGANVFGIHVLGLVASSNTWEYVDFRWITVTYEPEYQCGWEVDYALLTMREGYYLSQGRSLPTIWYEDASGIRQGMQTIWYDQAKTQLMSIFCYYDGVTHGLYAAWWENGNKRSEVGYSHGEFHGLYAGWYENGNKRIERHYSNGDGFYGPWRQWYETGGKMFERNYQDGRNHGLFVEWYENGNKKSERTYTNGSPTGIAYYWRENGSCSSIYDHDNGKSIPCP